MRDRVSPLGAKNTEEEGQAGYEMRMRVGTLLYAMGIFCLVLTVGMLAGGFVARRVTRQRQLEILRAFEEKQQTLYKNDHIYTGAGKSDYVAVSGETLAILRLDRLKIKVSVVEGIEKASLKLSAGHFSESALPGEGNFAIAGHSSREYVCLFNDLHEAVIGDLIVVTTRDYIHTYLVSEILTVEPEQVEYLRQTNESVLTIITCTNDGRERLMIRGIEV